MYDIIEADDAKQLASEVKDRLNHGWIPVGGPFILSTYRDEEADVTLPNVVCQAVVDHRWLLHAYGNNERYLKDTMYGMNARQLLKDYR